MMSDSNTPKKEKSQLSEKTSCLILGGNSDIGKAIAAEFAKNKYDLVLTSRMEEKYDFAFSDKLKKAFDVNVAWKSFDGLDFHSHQKFVDELEPFPRLVICVYGYLGNPHEEECSSDELLKIIQSNFTSQASILNRIAPKLSKLGGGKIVGVSSVAGMRGRSSNYVYGASKAGFNAFLSGLRNRYFKEGVHVMSVIPGYVNTKMSKGIAAPSFLIAEADQVAKSIYNGVHKNKNKVYVLPVWRYIMFVIKCIPEFIFKRLNL